MNEIRKVPNFFLLQFHTESDFIFFCALKELLIDIFLLYMRILPLNVLDSEIKFL